MTGRLWCSRIQLMLGYKFLLCDQKKWMSDSVEWLLKVNLKSKQGRISRRILKLLLYLFFTSFLIFVTLYSLIYCCFDCVIYQFIFRIEIRWVSVNSTVTGWRNFRGLNQSKETNTRLGADTARNPFLSGKVGLMLVSMGIIPYTSTTRRNLKRNPRLYFSSQSATVISSQSPSHCRSPSFY